MEELQNLIKFLKTKGLKDQKIPLDVWVGIIEYFASKQKPEQCDIAVVSHCADELEPIIANITELGFTTPSDHGIIKLELPYQYYKLKGWKKGDKIEIKHCG